jgi:hypothetical protein
VSPSSLLGNREKSTPSIRLALQERAVSREYFTLLQPHDFSRDRQLSQLRVLVGCSREQRFVSRHALPSSITIYKDVGESGLHYFCPTVL